ncbi:hypothetical protein A1D29_02775 [Pasteurellaceae bacterium Orientalotternb1]|nr:hypothetical protein A1D29_02775 [Pasteurellaceae bacterium Orientalotternb1]
MKKVLLALLMAMFSLSGCDQKTAQKLRVAEQRVTELESELAILRTQNANLPFPALQVEIVEFFNRSETVNAEQVPTVEAQVSVSRAKTGVEWLDLLLLKEAVLHFRIDEVDLYPFTEKKVIEFFNDLFEENKYFAKRENMTHFDDVRFSYVGQRHHIVTFKLQRYGYAGGASTSGYEVYVNVDTNKKAVIRPEDLVAEVNAEKLWALLDKYDEKQNGEDSDLKLSDGYYRQATYSFYFTEYGVNFVLSPQLEVKVPYNELRTIMNQAYFPKALE